MIYFSSTFPWTPIPDAYQEAEGIVTRQFLTQNSVFYNLWESQLPIDLNLFNISIFIDQVIPETSSETSSTGSESEASNEGDQTDEIVTSSEEK